MKITIHSVAGHGDQTHERIQLTVVQKCNLDHYMVADTTYTGENSVSNKVRHTHWFSPLDVSAGDAVVLYTKPGTYSSTRRPDGGTNHYLYWGLSKPVWNDAGDGALLFQIDTWTGKRVK
jgi:hypothetical protein